MTSSSKWRLRRYVDPKGSEPFSDWLNKLDTTAGRRIRVLLARVEAGNLSALKWLGGGLGEIKIDIGPGYRVYVTRQGSDELVLLAGGDKSSQERDIRLAKSFMSVLKGKGKS